ncbi:MAG: choice-of-anchor X domain-containing protein [Candidatus Bipolaricaulota bacterium]
MRRPAASKGWHRLVLLGMAGLLTSMTSCTRAPAPDEMLAYGATWTSVRPSVVWCGDRLSTVTIETHVQSPSRVISARIVGPNETISLHDDGSHGDRVAGDGVFTASEVRPYCHSRFTLRFERSLAVWSGRLLLTTADGKVWEDPVPLRIGLVNPKYRLKSDVATWGDGVSTTANAIFIQDVDHRVFDRYPVSATPIDEALRVAARMVYRTAPDVFDFLVLMPAMPMFAADGGTEVAAASVRVSNDVLHIGIPIFNDAGDFSSSGRLQSAIFHSFGSLDLVDREIVRRWAPDAGVPLGLAHSDAEGCGCWVETSDIGGHLAAAAQVDGRLGRLVSSGEGTWSLTPVPQTEPYAPLEMYLMGLLPSSLVPPVHILLDPKAADSSRVTGQQTRTVTAEEIVAALGGEREPASASGEPILFTVAFVIVGEDPFGDAEYAFYTLLSYMLASSGPPLEGDLFSPFSWATGGKAALDTDLPFAAPPSSTER